MKKLVNTFFLCLFGFAFLGCADPNNTNENKPVKSINPTEQKIALYNKLLGSWTLGEYQNDYTFDNIIIASDSITADGVRYDINLSEDLFLPSEIPEEKRWPDGYPLYIEFLDALWVLEFDKNDEYISTFGIGKVYFDELNNLWNARMNDFVRVSGGGEDAGSGFDGVYSFTTATGSQTNGSITLNNGTWSYNGSKNNVAASSGSYTVNGSNITFNWTAQGSNVSTTVTVSASASSSYTWTADNVTLFSMLFGVTSTQMTFSYSSN